MLMTLRFVLWRVEYKHNSAHGVDAKNCCQTKERE